MSRVLIVDDEDAVRAVILRWLEAAGHTVWQASSAEAALEVLKTHTCEVMLTDVQMPPGHDGLWLIARVREQHPAIGVVLATTVDTVAPVISMQAGVIHYLVKPLIKDRVLAAIEAATAWHHEHGARSSASAKGDPIGEWMRAGSSGRRAPDTPQE